MTPEGFRKLALSMPGSVEKEHMNHPDFRVAGRIFATIAPDDAYGVVMLTPSQQKEFLGSHPAIFSQVKGGWGRGGATRVLLKSATPTAAKAALLRAWRNKAGDEPPALGRRSVDRKS